MSELQLLDPRKLSINSLPAVDAIRFLVSSTAGGFPTAEAPLRLQVESAVLSRAILTQLATTPRSRRHTFCRSPISEQTQESRPPALTLGSTTPSTGVSTKTLSLGHPIFLNLVLLRQPASISDPATWGFLNENIPISDTHSFFARLHHHHNPEIGGCARQMPLE